MPAKQKKPRIVIADDDPAIIDSLKILLEFSEYEVVTYEPGTPLANIEKASPDVVLLDVWMSGEDGKEICKRIKSNEKTKHLPVILISAGRDVEKAAAEAGADDFIAKPFEMNDLLDKISRFVGKQ